MSGGSLLLWIPGVCHLSSMRHPVPPSWGDVSLWGSDRAETAAGATDPSESESGVRAIPGVCRHCALSRNGCCSGRAYAPAVGSPCPIAMAAVHHPGNWRPFYPLLRSYAAWPPCGENVGARAGSGVNSAAVPVSIDCRPETRLREPARRSEPTGIACSARTRMAGTRGRQPKQFQLAA